MKIKPAFSDEEYRIDMLEISVVRYVLYSRTTGQALTKLVPFHYYLPLDEIDTGRDRHTPERRDLRAMERQLYHYHPGGGEHGLEGQERERMKTVVRERLAEEEVYAKQRSLPGGLQIEKKVIFRTQDYPAKVLPNGDEFFVKPTTDDSGQVVHKRLRLLTVTTLGGFCRPLAWWHTGWGKYFVGPR